MKTLLLTICISMIFLLLLKHNKQDKYEYDVLVKLHLDSAEIFNNQHIKIGSYKLPNHSPFGEVCAKDNE